MEYIFFHKKVFWQAGAGAGRQAGADNFNRERNYNDIFEVEKYEKESQKNRIKDFHKNNPNGYSDYQNNQNWNGDYQTNERNNNDDYQKDYQIYKARRTYKYFKNKVLKNWYFQQPFL